MTVRQLVPALLVLSLAMAALGSLWLPAARNVLTLLVAGYASLVLVTALGTLWTHGPRCAVAFAAVIPTLHFSYGIGFLLGVRDHLLSRRPPRISALSLSR
jgi:succinoglycan biosynthesis protein ExoA